tara:strand:+ start:2131 stop:3366 length:1236 start_codon:yes stop_codon:yes gene_type:complete
MIINYKILIKIIFVFLLNNLCSQTTKIPKNIKTVILKSSKSTGTFIDFGDSIELSFDDLDSDEKDYYYQINHFDYKWTSSNLSKSEFLEGFDDLRIKDFRNSFNTLKSYTHYSLKIPNNDVKLKISGNYKISIHLTNGEKIFEKRFSIVKNELQIQISVSKSNIIKNIGTDQKIKSIVNCSNCTKIYNNSSKLKLVVIKNNNWLNSQIIEKPKYVLSNKLIYEDIIFDGGNEFFNFDNSNINSTSIRIIKTILTDLYNNFLIQDKERTNTSYRYSPDINGEYVINSNKGYDLDIENDYARIFFKFKTDLFDINRKIYLLGKFNDFEADENYKLDYHEKSKSYKGSFLFKQGFYNYKYGYTNSLIKNKLQYFEGNFWETENSYRILLFHKKFNDKYFKIIGSNNLNSSYIKN